MARRLRRFPVVLAVLVAWGAELVIDRRDARKFREGLSRMGGI